MDTRAPPANGASILAEMREFARFAAATQRYIRRSLDIGLGREGALARWSRDAAEAASIRAQSRLYTRIEAIQASIPEDNAIEIAEPLMAPLITISAFDLGQGRLVDFLSYRFLYERLIGARVRPWLPAAFCAAAALPHLHPEHRRRLLRSLSEAAATAAGWSIREASFYPEWVDKTEPWLAG